MLNQPNLLNLLTESRRITTDPNKLFANMTTTQFCHWFHGFLTLENPEFISAAQTQIIKDHLALVFNKVTPDRGKIALMPQNIEVVGTNPHFDIGVNGEIIQKKNFTTKDNTPLTGGFPKAPPTFSVSNDFYGKPYPFNVHANGPNGFQLEFKPNTMITC